MLHGLVGVPILNDNVAFNPSIQGWIDRGTGTLCQIFHPLGLTAWALAIHRLSTPCE